MPTDVGKYLLVASLGFAIDFFFFLVLVFWGFSIYAANIIAFLIGSSFNVYLIRRWVYHPKRRFWVDVTSTWVVNGFVILLSTAMLGVLTTLGWSIPLAKLVAASISFSINFIIRRLFY